MERKIKIFDDNELRKSFYNEYTKSSKNEICNFALLLATHILELVKYPTDNNEIISLSFQEHKRCLDGKIRVHDLRKVGFKVHQLARSEDNNLYHNALRTLGQAIATAHMQEHVIVASDYAIKVINIMYPNNIEEIKKERLWQIKTLRSLRTNAKH